MRKCKMVSGTGRWKLVLESLMAATEPKIVDALKSNDEAITLPGISAIATDQGLAFIDSRSAATSDLGGIPTITSDQAADILCSSCGPEELAKIVDFWQAEEKRIEEKYL